VVVARAGEESARGVRIPVTAALASTAFMLAAGSTPRADDSPALWLPTTAALAILEAPDLPDVPVKPARTRFDAPVGAALSSPSFIPQRIRIPDLYAIDFERDPPRFATPVDGNRFFAFEFVSPRGLRPRLAVTYDAESAPIGDGWDRVSVEIELPF
jgi:hypothetical protein